MGCRPDGHFHRKGVESQQYNSMFQWAVARMVTFTPWHYYVIHKLLFQWAVARMVTFTLDRLKKNESLPFQWAVARMVTFTYRWVMLRKWTKCFSGLSPGWSLSPFKYTGCPRSNRVSVGCRPDGHFHFFGVVWSFILPV